MEQETDSQNNKITYLIKILRKKKLFWKYQRFLPTPDYIQEIIMLTNSGDIKRAHKRTEKLHDMLVELDENVGTEVKAWLIDIISTLKTAINSKDC